VWEEEHHEVSGDFMGPEAGEVDIEWVSFRPLEVFGETRKVLGDVALGEVVFAP
jgi:hypothetical protein